MIRKQGFTLIEVLIVVVIVGLLASAAVPQFGDLIKRQSLLAESRRVITLIKSARSESRARGAVVTMHRLGGDWSSAVQVYENFDGVGVFVAGQDDLIKNATSSGRTLLVDESTNSQFVTFNQRGWVNAPVTFAICNSANDPAAGRQIVINRVGKISEGPIGNNSCTP